MKLEDLKEMIDAGAKAKWVVGANDDEDGWFLEEFEYEEYNKAIKCLANIMFDYIYLNIYLKVKMPGRGHVFEPQEGFELENSFCSLVVPDYSSKEEYLNELTHGHYYNRGCGLLGASKKDVIYDYREDLKEILRPLINFDDVIKTNILTKTLLIYIECTFSKNQYWPREIKGSIPKEDVILASKNIEELKGLKEFLEKGGKII